MPVIDQSHGIAHGAGAQPRPIAGAAAWGSEGVPYIYLFPTLANNEGASLPPGVTQEEYLVHLAALSRRISFLTGPKSEEESTIPAAYTYLGQFIDHDMTAPLARAVAGTATQVIPAADNIDELTQPKRAGNVASILDQVRNQQERPLALDGLYGDGPFSADQEIASLYEATDPVFVLAEAAAWTPARFAADFFVDKDPFHATGAKDLPRDHVRRLTLIADRRNDENLVVSQLHLAFMLFHNKVVRTLAPQFTERRALFNAARQLVTWHYHWIVEHDYLSRVLAPGTINTVRARRAAGQGLIRVANRVPMEFSVAAFRFGHTMIRNGYDFNANFGKDGRLMPLANLDQLFRFTSRGGLAGTDQLPDHWVIDWQRFLDITPGLNRAAGKLDTHIAPSMMQLMGSLEAEDRSIVRRNLRRGFARRIPTGQRLAEALGIEPLPPATLLKNLKLPQFKVLEDEVLPFGFEKATPAWFYFLCEAEHIGGGNCLGPVASRLIGETILGLLDLSPVTYPRFGAKAWTPQTSPLRTPDGSPIVDLSGLLKFAGVLGSPEMHSRKHA